jgi:hypothetical protein
MMSHKSVSGPPLKRLTAGGQLSIFLDRENLKRAKMHCMVSNPFMANKATPIVVGRSAGLFVEK